MWQPIAASSTCAIDASSTSCQYGFAYSTSTTPLNVDFTQIDIAFAWLSAIILFAITVMILVRKY